MNRLWSLRSRLGAATLLAILLVGSLPMPAQAAVIRPFTPRFSLNTTGAITLTGNTLLTCPAAATSCLGARMGSGTTTVNNNNNYSMVFVDVDSNGATFNSSRNTLSIPATSTVLWAGLYWGADTTAGGGTGAAAPNAALRNQIMLQPPGGGSYLTLTASQLDSSPVTGGFRYQGFVDVTNIVTAGRSGEYTVANLQAGRGTDRYGGWALVVAYQDINEPVRNLTIFDGYAVVQQTPASDQNVAVPVSGFLTPPTGQVRSRVGVVTYEGDLGLLGDSLRLNATPLSNSLNPATNFFNSSLTSFNGTIATGDPFYTNMLGFDIDTIRADGILANGATSATINLNTNNDTYFPGVVSFSTELFSPRLDLGKSAVDLNGGSLDPGDQILYTVQVTNNGDDGAAAVVLSDDIPAYTTYVPGSLLVNGASVTDGSGDDVGEFASGPARVVARLGIGANATVGGVMPIGAIRTVSFRVTVGTVPVDELVSNVADASYTGATSGLPLAAISNTVNLAPRPLSDLTMLKFGPSEPITLPGTIAYHLIVTNRGPAPEPAATITDVLPAGFTATSATSSQGTCSTGATVTCNLGALPVGGTASVDIVGTVAAGSGQITNTASVTGSNLDTLPNNNLASAVTVLNNPPNAIDQVASTPSATPVTIPVLTGSTDPDGDPVTTINAGPAGNGSVVVNPDGTVTYTPDPGFKGDDTFSFTVADGRGGFDTAVVTVTVANAPPLAVDDAAATAMNFPVTVTVLANDSDPNGDPLTVSAITTPPGNGTALINPGGTITYTPNAGFIGSDTFSYSISDGTDTSTAQVSIQVTDLAPAAVDDAVTTPSGIPVTIAVLANDVDPNGDPISVVPGSLSVPTAGGSVVLNVGDTVTYTPLPGFKGDDTFTYTITDGPLTSAPATVTVTVLNAPPVAFDDNVTTQPNAPIDILVTANDTDANGDGLTVIAVGLPTSGASVIASAGTITYTPNPGFKGVDTFTYTVSDGTDTDSATVSVTVPNTPPRPANDTRITPSDTPIDVPVLLNDSDANGDTLTVAAVSSPSNGNAVINPDGSITYTPNPGFVGIDSFVYTVSDGTDTATARVTITVLNGPPVGVDDLASTPAGSPINIPVLANDTDPNGDTLTVLTVSAPASGTAAINPDGTITYTPNVGFVGTDSFTYTLTDGTETATATVTVVVGNLVPVAVDDTALTSAGTAVTIPVLANDSDPNGDMLTVSAVTVPGSGTGVINPDGTITYTPNSGFVGIDTFTYTISDGADTATATVTVVVGNVPPVTVDDTATTRPGTPVIVPVLDNDSDPNGDPLTVISVTPPANGTAVINPDGTVTYTPDPGFTGTDTFTYTVSDGTNTSTSSVTVIVGNLAPIAVDDTASTPTGTPVTIPVLGNDSDPDGDAITVTTVTPAAHGTATINPDGTITYTPDAGFSGSDTFTYTITDGYAQDIATVTVSIGALPALVRTGLEALGWAIVALLLIASGNGLVIATRDRKSLRAE